MSSVPELKVSGATVPNKLGGAIVKFLHESPKIVVMAMGEKAVSQAVKGIIVAQSFLASSAEEFNLKMGFRTQEEEDKVVTVIVFHLERAW